MTLGRLARQVFDTLGRVGGKSALTASASIPDSTPMRAQYGGGAADHRGDPRFDAERVDVATLTAPPLWPDVSAVGRFQHPIVRRRRCLFLAGEPVGGQLVDRHSAERRRDVFTLSFDTSTVAANASASRLVLKPRRCVCPRSGVR